jgi:hypothetical protein
MHIDKLLRVTETSPTMVLHLAIHRLTQSLRRALQRCGVSNKEKVTVATDAFTLGVTENAKELHTTVKFSNDARITITVLEDGRTILQGESIEGHLRKLFEELFLLSKSKAVLPVKIAGPQTKTFVDAEIRFSRSPVAFKRSFIKKK